MTEAIVVALITGVCAIIAQAFISRQTNKDVFNRLDKQSELSDARLEKAQAVTDTKLDALTQEVRAHNEFARRMPVLEEQMREANHRIADLEKRTGG